MNNKHTITLLSTGFLSLAIATLLGAFGAHALKGAISVKAMVTYSTGNDYHFYHSFALILLGAIKMAIPEVKTKMTFISYLVGLFMFCGNCYLYALTSYKLFAMLVPIGGVAFILGHFTCAYNLYQLRGQYE